MAPEAITSIGNFQITNTFVTTFVIDAILLGFFFFVAKNVKIIPGKLQTLVEMLFSYFYNMAQAMSPKHVSAIFPWVMTFFLFIIVSNFLGLLPGVGSIGFTEKEIQSVVSETNSEKSVINTEVQRLKNNEYPRKENLIPLLRPATSDFNATLALATISLLATHALSIKYTGLKDYLKRFFNFNPILLFVGLLELVSEFIKIFSLSFRLFGNIYAGEVVLSTISGLFAFLAPLPFLLLESIVAIVQALVFAILTMAFMSILTQKHGEEH